ncbi:MAG: 3-deoxy-D-manno-octulosonic acid transferase [Rhodospirillaceae bacterium]|nr:MAG: 3-deoxy-D-manno-octulosonic acid transferase [Rhodospirillaceae bacterium]
MTSDAEAFGDYIIYVDESGDHSLKVVNPDNPLFVLAFCIVRKSDYAKSISPAIQKLKFDTFGHDMVVLHSHEIRKQKNDFRVLRNPKIRGPFLEQISKVVVDAPFTLIATVINKNDLKGQYATPYSPYDIALLFCMERAYKFLMANGQDGKHTHIIVEARGRKEDTDLKAEFYDIMKAKQGWKKSFDIRFSSKQSNSSGLQLADLSAHPIARHVLKPDQPNKAYEALEEKLMKGPTGLVHGNGLKVFP